MEAGNGFARPSAADLRVRLGKPGPNIAALVQTDALQGLFCCWATHTRGSWACLALAASWTVVAVEPCAPNLATSPTPHLRGSAEYTVCLLFQAKYRTQANAILRKNARFQQRNRKQTACILLAPVLYCLILLALQLAINNAFNTPDNKVRTCAGRHWRRWRRRCPPLSGKACDMARPLCHAAAAQCGCLCTSCCSTSANGTETCRTTATGGNNTCLPGTYDKCNTYDDSVCGLQQSSGDQAAFCAIPSPSSWPPVMQVSRA